MIEGSRIIIYLLQQPGPSYLAVQWLFFKLMYVTEERKKLKL
jgi:hypothetical protein